MTRKKRLPREHRLLNPDGRRFHRKAFSRREFRWGLVVCCGLVAILAWVLWRGAHPDPELFASGVELVGEARAAGPIDRGPLPEELAAAGWREESLAQFDASNVYEKINGREDYYKSFGFERLHFVTLRAVDAPGVVVDLELYDLGTAANALGAYAGERQPDVEVVMTPAGLSHRARNGMFMTRGRYYARAIGADESTTTLAQLSHLGRVLSDGLESEPVPWGYGLFVGQLGLDPGRVRYQAENAFSFAFGRQVFAAATGAGETEIFATVQSDRARARDLAGKYRDGFAEQGERLAGGWVRHRYLDEIAGAVAEGVWVIGVRAAPDPKTAERELARLRKVVRESPAELVRQAQDAHTSAGKPTDGQAPEEEY